jgi:hypothetical protein
MTNQAGIHPQISPMGADLTDFYRRKSAASADQAGLFVIWIILNRAALPLKPVGADCIVCKSVFAHALLNP